MTVQVLFINYVEFLKVSRNLSNRNITVRKINCPAAYRLIRSIPWFQICRIRLFGKLQTVSDRQTFSAVIGTEVIESLESFRYFASKRSQNPRLNYVKLPHVQVLVVDDNVTNLDVAKGLMRPYEMRVDCVKSGGEAIRAIRDEHVHYDAIFMDHMMPEMNGDEALLRIRELDTEWFEPRLR